MRITSSAFADGETIPTRYTCDGQDISPPLVITDAPPGTESLTLIVDDPDAPVGTWDHWVAFDIAPTVEIPEDVGQIGTAGTNSWGRTGFGGPCPPSGVHRYFFKLFALDVTLGLQEGADKAEVMAALEGHVLAEATMIGRYGR